MSIKITVPNTGGDYLTFGSGNTPTAAQIGGYDDGSSNGHLEFYTTASGTSTERMRIDNAGNVGIGTSSPTSLGSGYGTLDVRGGTGGGFRWGNSTNSAYTYSDSSDTVIATATSKPLIFGTNSTERLRIDSSGNLLVGTTTINGANSSGLAVATGTSYINIGHPNGTASGYSYVNFGYNGTQIGYITQNGTTAVAYNTTSDYRLKENVQPLSGALDRIAALKPCTYTWKAAPDEIGEGFIAHELAEICPHAVTGEKDAVDADGNPVYQGIDTSFLIATLTAAIQELKTIVDEQAAKITALENK